MSCQKGNLYLSYPMNEVDLGTWIPGVEKCLVYQLIRLLSNTYLIPREASWPHVPVQQISNLGEGRVHLIN